MKQTFETTFDYVSMYYHIVLFVIKLRVQKNNKINLMNTSKYTPQTFI